MLDCAFGILLTLAGLRMTPASRTPRRHTRTEIPARSPAGGEERRRLFSLNRFVKITQTYSRVYAGKVKFLKPFPRD